MKTKFGFRAYDEWENQWIDEVWEKRHGWLLMDSDGWPVLIQEVDARQLLRNVEIDFVEGGDGLTIRERITFHLREWETTG